MKKIFYFFLLALASSLTITACSDEEIKPSSVLDHNGGGHIATDGRN